MQHWSFKYIGCSYFWLKFKQTQTQKIHKFKKNEQLHDSIKCVELHSFYVRRPCSMHIGLLYALYNLGRGSKSLFAYLPGTVYLGRQCLARYLYQQIWQHSWLTLELRNIYLSIKDSMILLNPPALLTVNWPNMLGLLRAHFSQQNSQDVLRCGSHSRFHCPPFYLLCCCHNVVKPCKHSRLGSTHHCRYLGTKFDTVSFSLVCFSCQIPRTISHCHLLCHPLAICSQQHKALKAQICEMCVFRWASISLDS